MPVTEKDATHEAALSAYASEELPAHGPKMALDAAVASSNVSNESSCLLDAKQRNLLLCKLAWVYICIATAKEAGFCRVAPCISFHQSVASHLKASYAVNLSVCLYDMSCA